MVISKYFPRFNSIAVLMIAHVSVFNSLKAQIPISNGTVDSASIGLEFQAHPAAPFSFNEFDKVPFGKYSRNSHVRGDIIVWRRGAILNDDAKHNLENELSLASFNEDTLKYNYLYSEFMPQAGQPNTSNYYWDNFYLESKDTNLLFTSAELIKQFSIDSARKVDLKVYNSIDSLDWKGKKWTITKIPGYLIVTGIANQIFTDFFWDEKQYVCDRQVYYFREQKTNEINSSISCKDTSYSFNIRTSTGNKKVYKFDVNQKTPICNLLKEIKKNSPVYKAYSKQQDLIYSQSPRFKDSIIGNINLDFSKWSFLQFHFKSVQTRLNQSHADYQDLYFTSSDTNQIFSTAAIITEFSKNENVSIDSNIHNSLDVTPIDFKKWYFIKLPGYLIVRCVEDLGSEKSAPNSTHMVPLFVSQNEQWYFLN